MRFGVCATPEAAPILKKAGFKFLEIDIQSHLMPESPDHDFMPVLDMINGCELPCVAANNFIPGRLKMTGPDVSMKNLTRFVESVCGRALRSGITTIVFASGVARSAPEGFCPYEARQQLVEFGRMAAHIASNCGMTIVVKPMCKQDCGILNRVGETAEYVREVGHHCFRLLVDSYHWMKEKDSAEDLLSAAHLISHVHVATANSKKAPGLEECDFSPFFKALRKSGYGGDVSVRGSWNDMESEAPIVYARLCEMAQAAQ